MLVFFSVVVSRCRRRRHVLISSSFILFLSKASKFFFDGRFLFLPSVVFVRSFVRASFSFDNIPVYDTVRRVLSQAVQLPRLTVEARSRSESVPSFFRVVFFQNTKTLAEWSSALEIRWINLLGDNFYPHGVIGVDDPLWDDSFNIPFGFASLEKV